MAITKGRRVNSFSEIIEPGDYFGPTKPEGANSEYCYFLLPIPLTDYRSLHSVSFPPHTYRECEDGSLEIRNSIGAHGSKCGSESNEYIWHGFLDEGHNWREV